MGSMKAGFWGQVAWGSMTQNHGQTRPFCSGFTPSCHPCYPCYLFLNFFRKGGGYTEVRPPKLGVDSMSRLLDAATKYIRAGLCPLPLWPDRRKNPHLKETLQFNHRLPTESEWQKWAARWPTANIGLVTGHHHNLCCLDFDDQLSFDVWRAGFGDDCPTWVVTTGRGYHVWFYDLSEPGKSRLFVRDGLEVLLRAKGGYCIVPPSIHWQGKPYKSLNCEKPFHIAVGNLLAGWNEKQETLEHSQPGQRPYLADTKIRIEHLIPPVKPHPNSRGAMLAFCPFHDDRRQGGTPSAWVNPKEQRFGCNKCWPGQWWDVINVYAMLSGVNNTEAFKTVRGVYV